ncbi:cytochrome D1 domain-containing protein [Arhodomonas sp. SL1]|uniref:cytochrome D1 domain-containing protein n=1 Tax=Arhodomonas sp. SL1 TaxID=3425691 RepID=UPI003F88216A
MLNPRCLLAVALLLSPGAAFPAGAEVPDGAALYESHCAACHGDDRLGGLGPALLPGNLGRLAPEDAEQVITEGRAATQMPAYGEVLSEAEITALVEHIYQAPEEPPRWVEADIRGSHRGLREGDGPGAPVFDADPMNLFLVVEKGDHHITVLDGDRFEPIHRFPTRYALHGGVKYSPDGRYAYLMSRDGWVTQYDIHGLEKVAEVRAGINSRNIAVSADGRFVAVANYLPNSLVILDADGLRPLAVIPVANDHGEGSRVSAVYTAPPRQSFIAALKDIREVWEIPYADGAEALPVYRGIMHDYREESGEAPPIDRRRFPVRRIKVDSLLDDFFFDPEYRHLVGASRQGGGQVVNLTVGRVIATLDIPGMPHLGSGISFRHGEGLRIASPNLREGRISIIDPERWAVVDAIDTLGPGFFMRSHPETRYLWADVFFGPNKDVLHVIDKETLEIVETLRPAPGETAAHVEFTHDGSHALVSIWEEDGALVVYDAETLEEVRRIPMKRPSGKYNVGNKTAYIRGTSH